MTFLGNQFGPKSVCIREVPSYRLLKLLFNITLFKFQGGRDDFVEKKIYETMPCT